MVRILSLDDEPEMLDLIGLILEHVGYEHLKVTDSHEALSILHSEPIDLLTQDLVRPDLNGWALCQQIRDDEALHDLPIIIISAKVVKQEETTRVLTVDGYLTKPFGPVDLLLAVSDVLSRKEVPQPPIPSALQALDPRLKQPACQVLLQSARSVPEDPDGEQRIAALETLTHVDEEDLGATLIAALANNNLWIRWIAIQALANLEEQRATSALIVVLNDESERVRRAAAHTLGVLKDPQSVTPLITALMDEDANVVATAIQALGQIADPQAIPALERLVQEGTQRLGHGLMVAETARRAIQTIERAQEQPGAPHLP